MPVEEGGEFTYCVLYAVLLQEHYDSSAIIHVTGIDKQPTSEAKRGVLKGLAQARHGLASISCRLVVP